LSVFLWPCYCLSFVSFPLTMIWSVFFQLPFVLDIVCLLSVSLWPCYCLSFVSFPLAMILDNNMDKGKLTKDRQYHGQREADKRQTISWPKRSWKKTDNIMAKGKLTKDRQ
jgi:hypothetical protein